MEVVLLDDRIAVFVLLPIFLAVTLVSVLRQSLVASNRTPRSPDLQRMQINSLLQRSSLLRGPKGRMLSPASFQGRVAFFTDREHGAFGGLLRELEAQNNPMKSLESLAKQDPSQTMGMLKSQMSFIFLQGGMAYFINYLFPDFLVAKMPFPLTFRFKSMLQRGIDLPSLDVTYVSSLSWYFLIMLSNAGLLFLFTALWGSQREQLQPLAEARAEEQSGVQTLMMMDAAMPPMMMPGIGGPDPKKQLTQEREALETATHAFALEGVEKQLLEKFQQDVHLGSLDRPT
ncbi:putative membrane protein [Toxoplasma gondii TgCatPRC2]|uniref:ER membrane protein complex subunit 3 n=18 Tax=Toxoplasma gondii TaxID=5811 RepID=B9PHI9_TOXGV|nr:membrane protein, putative [Toxoplasma gondii ME49]EPR64177.1 putative membrane protein [Toxoplasma gondii GT1]ESS35672.1 putative membrane protein [Toxoplasma gondii VEG]KAF4641647.1 putative membrane protein [Toxoplasma gondii]KFG48188.1 putative membrane protein [Toxoplasma gondii GAB2-2007-GAL-DOM2]KFG55534.1 putative membrane protein [Toxoplasma gondii FOU]KFG63554.1 putative membrane protein [Toxoplasma gondii RUB]KFH03109.1 putative membrane protein [Toxoplasma gondii VAND]KFH1756|eukprot:XP_002367931.1 membrane protein, putative [Toxoplasma gondii ME49]